MHSFQVSAVTTTHPASVTVSIDDEDDQTLEFDYVIVAIPIVLVPKIEFTPRLPEPFYKSLDAVRFSFLSRHLSNLHMTIFRWFL
jgi:monoamine oxidase